MHRDHILPELVGVVTLKLRNEQAGASRVTTPEARHGGFAGNLPDIEVRAWDRDVCPW
jgi:hypothetical protein